jgi:methionyl-tRNA formyltransferase
MKIIILSCFPLLDNHYYKNMILEGLINEKPDELLIVYSHVHLKDYYNEFKKRIKDFKVLVMARVFRVSRNNISKTKRKTWKLKNIAKQNNIQVLYYKRFADRDCVECMKIFQPDIIHNLSGTYIPKKILDIPKVGVVSGHYALLPDIRGGDSIRWSILLDVPIFVTHMLLDKELDMGDILRKKKIKIDINDDLEQIKEKCQLENSKGHLELYGKFSRQEKYDQTKQKSEQGHVYYRMGKYMRDKIDLKLKNGGYLYAGR